MILHYTTPVPPHAPGNLVFTVPRPPSIPADATYRIIEFTAMKGDGGPDMTGRFEIVKNSGNGMDRQMAIVGDYDSTCNPPNIHYMAGGGTANFLGTQQNNGGIRHPIGLGEFHVLPTDTLYFEILDGTLVVSRIGIVFEV